MPRHVTCYVLNHVNAAGSRQGSLSSGLSMMTPRRSSVSMMVSLSSFSTSPLPFLFLLFLLSSPPPPPPPHIWHSDEQLGDVSYVNLVLNPERYTGYSGHSPQRIWNAIYRENCFRFPDITALSPSLTFNPSPHPSFSLIPTDLKTLLLHH